MNAVAADKYGELADKARGMVVFAEALKAKDDEFRPFGQYLDDVESQGATGGG